MKSVLSYMKWPLIVTVAGLVLAGFVGWEYERNLGGVLTFLFIAAVLAVLEISLSFDNSIVNAQKLRTMTPVWQHRFLTWGIVIAVFGMRIVFPLLIVVIAAHVNPWEAVVLAASRPDEYSRIIHDAHLPIAAFGGSFLMLVALRFFLDQDKAVDWVPGVETAFRWLGAISGIAVGVVLIAVLVVIQFLPAEDGLVFISSAIWGIVTYLLVDALGHVLDRWNESTSTSDMARSGLGGFLYLEVLDASFSFDGVIGAFALTHNLFLIAIGLGVGAMFVRSMTIMLVEKGTLAQFRYLEHGAFWSVLVLSVIMFIQTLHHVPEAVTGLLGASFIGVALVNSILWRKRHPGLVPHQH